MFVTWTIEHLDGEEKGVNQPVIQRRENMEFSPNKKAMPIIISNSANVTTIVSLYLLAQGTILWC